MQQVGGRVRRAGVFRPGVVRLARQLWTWSPLRRRFSRQLDSLLGIILSVQILQHLFIENRPPNDPFFPMEDRTPRLADHLAA